MVSDPKYNIPKVSFLFVTMAYHNTKILIIGAGTLGFSRACHLVQSGYKIHHHCGTWSAFPSLLTAAKYLKEFTRADSY